jgi:hypothetical protein
MSVTHIEETQVYGSLGWWYLPHASSGYSGIFGNPADQGFIREGGTLVCKSHQHHRRHDQGVTFDGSLGQKSTKTMGPLHCDRCKPQHKEYMTNQDAVDASDIVTKVMHLETTLSPSLHLIGAPINETLNHLCIGWKAIAWPRVLWVAYLWCSHDVADEGRSHNNLFLPDPCSEGVTAPIVQVGVELMDYLLDCRAVVHYHIYPALGI